MALGHLNISIQRVKLVLYLTAFIKGRSKCIKEPNISDKIIKKGKHVNFCDLGLGNSFL